MSYERDDFVSTTPEWYEAWIQHFGHGDAGIWSSSDGTSGVRIPYCKSQEMLGPLAIPAAIGAGNSHTPRFDVLGSIESPDIFDRMLRDIDAHMLTFGFVSKRSQLMVATERFRNDLSYLIDFCESAPYVDCSGSWDEYWKGRGSSRTEWARRERKLMNDQKAVLECLTDWSIIEPRFEDILALEATGWKGAQGSAIIQSADTLGFYRQMTRTWAEQGRLRLFTLSVDGKPVAFELLVDYNGRLNCFKHGYDDAWAKQGPGMVLRILVLKWAFAEQGVSIFDMFGPESEAKRKWATGVENLYTVRVFRRSLRGLLGRLRYDHLPKLKRRFQNETRTNDEMAMAAGGGR